MFADDRDLSALTAGMAEARRIMDQPAMAGLTNGLFEPESSCQTDADWADNVRNHATYGAHPIGTCRMGQDDDAVVDPDLRVRGMEGLRVIDASVMPTTTTGNTNAPSMMIGERGAALLLGSPVAVPR